MGKLKSDQDDTPSGDELFGGFGPVKAVEEDESPPGMEDPEGGHESSDDHLVLQDDSETDEGLSPDDLDELLKESGFPGTIPPGRYRLRERTSLIPLVDGESGMTWKETVLLKNLGELDVVHRANLRREVDDYTRDETWCVIEVEGLPALACIDDLMPDRVEVTP